MPAIKLTGDGERSTEFDPKLIYGTAQAEADLVLLKTGPLSARFSAGGLRDIRFAGVEVIRGIHFLVRDRNWSTLVPELTDLEIDEKDGRFLLTYRAFGRTGSDGQSISWTGRIAGSSGGLRMEVATDTSAEDFLTCRTGFVILHPVEKVAGCPVTVTHSDGSAEETRFPLLIDPLQCFFDVAAMSHSPLPGVTATCRMEGGAWETEDHRNWMDASYKTYFRALSLPWPYSIPAGEMIRQAVELTLQGSAPASASADDARPIVVLGDATGQPAPDIGLFYDPLAAEATLAVADQVRSLGVRHLTVRVSTDGRDLPGQLARAVRFQRKTACPIVLEIIVSERGLPVADEIELVAVAAGMAGLKPQRVSLSPAQDLVSYPPSVDRPAGPSLALVYASGRAAFPGVPVGGGSFAFFTELNRRRPLPGTIDFLQWGTASINHAADDLSVMETLQTISHQIASARAIGGLVPLRIGPVNIAMPINPYGESTSPNPAMQRVTMARRDPRHGAQFGAAFAAGYLARATQGGAASVTFNAPAGDFGLFDGADAIPTAAVIRAFAEMSGGAVLQAATSLPQKLLAAAFDCDGRRRAILSNVSRDAVEATVAGWPIARISLLSGGARDFAEVAADGSTITLPAYSVAQLEG